MGHNGPMNEARMIEVVVEIPKGSRNKYEFDKQRGVIKLDRRLLSATTYPADYGFVPDTLADDGDALDALVLIDDPTFPGCWVTARPLGVFWMEDEKGADAKIVCVPANDPFWDSVESIDDLPEPLLEEIKHFFDVYKTLERKKTATHGYEGVEAAFKEIEVSRARYREDGSTG
jgi:inorganic pyrophosphatase